MTIQGIRWTNELIDAMMDLVEKRYSATMIGEKLSKRFEIEITRNAVAGKINRLKIGKREKPLVIHKWNRANSMSNTKIVAKIIDDGLSPPKSLQVYIGQLDSTATLGMCRYPSRDESGVAVYCGLPTVKFTDESKCSWCSWHRMFVTKPLRA